MLHMVKCCALKFQRVNSQKSWSVAFQTDIQPYVIVLTSLKFQNNFLQYKSIFPHGQQLQNYIIDKQSILRI